MGPAQSAGVTPTFEATEIEAEEPYQTPQPNIEPGTRFRVFPKNFRNQLCGCNSGKKFKKCCIDEVKSEHLYKVVSIKQ
jgi:rubredoxin